MTINCENIYQFCDCIEGLVRRGLTFRAEAETLVIVLTGGF